MVRGNILEIGAVEQVCVQHPDRHGLYFLANLNEHLRLRAGHGRT